jgi:hypothetical protein
VIKSIINTIRRKIISPIGGNIENICYYLKHHRHPVLSTIGWLVIILFFACVVPLTLDWAFKTPALLPVFAVAWKVEDALSFYGDILGAAATIFVLQRTIRFTVENQKDERKLSIKPYLETKKYNYTDVLKIPTDQDITYLNISKRGITFQGALPDDIMDLRILQDRMKNQLSIDPFDQATFDLRIETLMKTKYYLYYEVSNCGAGNAINVHLYVNNNPLLPSFCVTTDTPKKFMFILNSDLLDTDTNEYTHKLFFAYDDIASLARYQQSEYIIFSRSDTNNLKTFQQSGSLLTKPVEIPKEVRKNG